MNTQKQVFNKLFKKEELASQKVELALLDDLKTLTKEAFSGKQQTSALQSIQSKLDKSYSNYQLVFANADEAIKKAKDLGVDFKVFSDLKDNADKEMKSILKAISLINESVKVLN